MHSCGDENTDPEIRTVINIDNNYCYWLIRAVICIKDIPGPRHCARSFVHSNSHAISMWCSDFTVTLNDTDFHYTFV